MFATELFCTDLEAQRAIVLAFAPLLWLMNISPKGTYTGRIQII